MVDAIDAIEFVLVASRGRGAAGRAELHQAVPAALQHPPARRQVLSVHRDLDGRGVPARLLHARAPPPRPRVLRPLLERQARARHARPAGQGLPVPLLPGRRARAAHRARRAWTTTSSAAGRPASATSRREEYRESIDGVVAFLSGRYREIERDLEARMKAGVGGAGVRAGGARAQPPARRALAARAPARGQRVGRHARRRRRRGRRDRRQRPGLPGPRRRALRPPVVLPRERGRARAWARSPRSSCSSTTATQMAIPPQIIVQDDVDDRDALAEALGERRGGRGRGARRRARRQAPDPRARRAQRAARARPGALKAERRRQQRVEALDGLQEALGLDALPLRIECFDISNLMGTHTVASMVVFEGGAPKKSDYRRFNVRGLQEGVPDDFAAMEEVLGRRLAQWETQQDLSPARPQAQRVVRHAAQPDRHRRRPGPARGRAARAARASASAASTVISLAKRIEEVFVPGRRAADRARRTTRPSSSCCSACATRPTASRSPTTARAATAR